MTRKQRMLAAIRRQPVDRPPHNTYNFHNCSGSPHLADKAYRALLELVDATAGMLGKVGVAAGGLLGASPNARSETAQTGRGTMVTRVVPTPRGELRSVTVKPVDQPAYVVEALLKSDADAEALLALPWQPVQPGISAAAALEAELGERGLAYVAYADPFYTACHLFDFEDFTVRCLTDPAGVRSLVDELHRRGCEQLRRVAEACHGHDFLFYTAGPEVATPPMMPPSVFRDLVAPYHHELVGILHQAGHLVTLHCHGRVRQVLPFAMDCGFDLLEPLEPPPQGDISLAELIEAVEGRMALMGYVQDQDLHTAPEGGLRRHVAEVAGLVAGRTGYLMSPTCTPFQFPPTETFCRNYREWLLAADELLR